MASNSNKQIVTGIVVEALPNTLFKVQIDTPKNSDQNGSEDGADVNTPAPILAFLAGKMLLNRIRVMIGDRVTMELDPYGGKARITRRG
ncbi:MAG: translation initiation factor IF-1 [Candidatus Taylorbacteria bacterium]|nr:translation initiation factor IF-1 [Candidatus Taylorbacteria bacterium]